MNVTATCHHERTCCTSSHKNSRSCGVAFGLLLVGAGALSLAERAGMLGGMTATSFWPVLLVVPGVKGLFTAGNRGGRVFSAVQCSGVPGVACGTGDRRAGHHRSGFFQTTPKGFPPRFV